MDNLDLENIINSIKPSVVTPKLSEVQEASNEKKPKLVAKMIVKQMAEDYNKDDQNSVSKLVMHEGKAAEVKFLDVEPLMSGVWSIMSLMILQLSYGEQTNLIEAIYPKSAQFAAKAFAAVFTPGAAPESSEKPIAIQGDRQMDYKIDSANAGIAMILAMMRHQGYLAPVPDWIDQEFQNMNDLVDAKRTEDAYKDATDRAKKANLFNDR